ncbi:unnamed protein product, partial [Rhizoctonia solani]
FNPIAFIVGAYFRVYSYILRILQFDQFFQNHLDLINSHNYHKEQARNHESNTRLVENRLLRSTQHTQTLNEELRKTRQEWTDVCEELEVAEELLQETREELQLLKKDHEDNLIAQRAQHQRLRTAHNQAEAQVDKFHAQIQDIISNSVGYIAGYEDHTIYAYVNTYQPFAPDNDR